MRSRTSSSAAARASLLREPPARGSPSVPNDRSAPDDLWFLNSTSGTTGLPKIVQHTQARWFAFDALADRVAHFTADDVFCSVLPAPFGFGLWTAHFSPAIAGAACVVCERFDPDVVLGAIERFRVTVLAAVSTQFVMMLNSAALDRYDLSSLRIMFTGGEMVPYERAKEFEDRTGASVLQFYGSNETGALSCTTPEDPQDKRLRTAGRVIPEMHVRLLDPDTGRRRHRARRRRAYPRARARPSASATGTTGPRTTSCSPPTVGCAWATSRPSTPTATSPSSAAPPTSSSAAARTSAPRRSRTRSARTRRSRCARPSPYPTRRSANASASSSELRAGADPFDLDALRAHLAARGTGKELWPERLVVVDALPRSSGGKVAKGDLRALAAAGDAIGG